MTGVNNQRDVPLITGDHLIPPADLVSWATPPWRTGNRETDSTNIDTPCGIFWEQNRTLVGIPSGRKFYFE